MTRWLLILACVAAGMMEVAAAVAFWLSDAKRAAQKIRHRRGIADCRLPIADCRLPIADCRLPIADCRLPIADCRLPIADCRLPIADCRLPIADCRLPIADCRFYGNGVCGQVILVGLYHVFSSCIMPMASATDKSHYTHKKSHSRHSRPCGAGMTIILAVADFVYCQVGQDFA